MSNKSIINTSKLCALLFVFFSSFLFSKDKSDSILTISSNVIISGLEHINVVSYEGNKKNKVTTDRKINSKKLEKNNPDLRLDKNESKKELTYHTVKKGCNKIQRKENKSPFNRNSTSLKNIIITASSGGNFMPSDEKISKNISLDTVFIHNTIKYVGSNSCNIIYNLYLNLFNKFNTYCYYYNRPPPSYSKL